MKDKDKDTALSMVIAGLDPAIHEAARWQQSYVSLLMSRRLMDARVKPAHDVERVENTN